MGESGGVGESEGEWGREGEWEMRSGRKCEW